MTRTFALRDSRIPTQAIEKRFLVQTAQQGAARAAEGALASDVDAAARDVIVGKAWASSLLIDLATVSGVIYRDYWSWY